MSADKLLHEQVIIIVIVTNIINADVSSGTMGLQVGCRSGNAFRL